MKHTDGCNARTSHGTCMCECHNMTSNLRTRFEERFGEMSGNNNARGAVRTERVLAFIAQELEMLVVQLDNKKGTLGTIGDNVVYEMGVEYAASIIREKIKEIKL